MSFDSLGLSAKLISAVRDAGYTAPTPIQAQAIPLVLAGEDVMASAQTGTGKTAAFTLPLLEGLGRTKPSQRPRALILTPTRELAAQVEDNLRTYGRNVRFRSLVICGGVNIKPQTRKLKSGVDILVATPGRLLDHINQGNVSLSGIEFFVLDEADRMLDMGFIRDIRKIEALLPKKHDRQNLMFSATFSDAITKLAHAMLCTPKRVEVAPRNTTADRLEQNFHPVDKQRKREVVSHLIGAGNWPQVLVFTRTKHGANRLAQQLERDGLNSAAIHGNKSQAARTKALDAFKRGKVRVLVATDIAARGIDVDKLSHVVNFELPNVAEDYVHRIGRTARAGESGKAVSLVSDDERDQLRGIQRLLKKDFELEQLPGYETDWPNQAPSKKSKKPARKSSGNRKRHGRANANGEKRNSNGNPWAGNKAGTANKARNSKGNQKRSQARAA